MLAEADVRRITASKARKTRAAVQALVEGSRTVENPSLMRIYRTVAKIKCLCESNRDQLVARRTHKNFGHNDCRNDVRFLGFKKCARLNLFSECFGKGNSSVIFLDRIADEALLRSAKRYSEIDVAIEKPGILVRYLPFRSSAGIIDKR